MSLLAIAWTVLCWGGGTVATLIILALAADFILQLEGRAWHRAVDADE